jgi:hypothetical protein
VAASVSPLARRLVHVLNELIEQGRDELERPHDEKVTANARGRIFALRQCIGIVHDEDRAFDPDADEDDEQQPRTTLAAVADEIPG